MPQFRLTKKYATDCKVTTLSKPQTTASLLDDWIIDVFRVGRRKVAMATHTRTLLTFLLPYRDIGGASNVPDCLGLLFARWLYDYDLVEATEQAHVLFESPTYFCKTDNRQVLGHMKEFKFMVAAFIHDTAYDDIDWNDISNKLSRTVASLQKSDCVYPVDQAIATFSLCQQVASQSK